MSDLSPLCAAKRTSGRAVTKSAFDPSGTLAAKKIESLTCSVVDAVALADVDDLAVEGHPDSWSWPCGFPFACRCGRSRHDGRVVDWKICAGAELLQT